MTGFRIRSGLILASSILVLAIALFGTSARAQVYKMGAPDQHLQARGIDTTLTVAVQELAPGVYAAKVSYVWTGWVELPDGILVIDTGLNERAGKMLADSIRG